MIDWDCKEDHSAFYDTPHFPQLLSLCAIPPIPIHILFYPARPKTLVICSFYKDRVEREVRIYMADVYDGGMKGREGSAECAWRVGC